MAKKTSKNSGIESILSNIKWDESYVSLAIGVIVVIIVAILGIAFLRNNNTDTSSTQFQPTVELEESEEAQKAAPAKGKTYTVKAGDTLWSIAESSYKSGYNWVDIAKENKILDANIIAEGSKIMIPEVAEKTATVITEVKQAAPKIDISGNSYKIKKGDDLWTIAVRAYGDGYSWTKIAEANKLVTPDLIYEGVELKLPR
ncbi:MAG: LysM peptidoglycan-binding domain-containing protein [Patescibacteria group bacterium]